MISEVVGIIDETNDIWQQIYRVQDDMSKIQIYRWDTP